jgi:glycosyltransferase involved in cell wall biosynthesis
MHFGKPVFLSDKTCLPEIGGDFAYYFHDFDPDAMRTVLADGLSDFQYRQPAASIIKYASRFSWETAAKKYLEVYNQLLALD